MRIDKRAENRVMPIVGPWWGQNNTDTFGLRPGQLWSNERGKFYSAHTYLIVPERRGEAQPESVMLQVFGEVRKEKRSRVKEHPRLHK